MERKILLKYINYEGHTVIGFSKDSDVQELYGRIDKLEKQVSDLHELLANPTKP